MIASCTAQAGGKVPGAVPALRAEPAAEPGLPGLGCCSCPSTMRWVQGRARSLWGEPGAGRACLGAAAAGNALALSRGHPCSPGAHRALGVSQDRKKQPLLYLERSCSRTFLSQLFSQLIVQIFYPAVKTCVDSVCSPLDIGSLIQDFIESSKFLQFVKRPSLAFLFHIFVEEAKSE